VIRGDDTGRLQTLSSCGTLRGDEVVREAIAALGEGVVPPWRPDLMWTAQWLLLAAAIIELVRRRWRRARLRSGTKG
jgi:hypothetical protein